MDRVSNTNMQGTTMSINHEGASDGSANTSTIDLVLHQVLGGFPYGVNSDTSMFTRVVQYIERNIESPELSPQSICRRVGISRSQLYRLFVSAGGVANYIRLSRLLKARAELASSARQRISNVAYKYGFTSHAHFSRVFKQHFGCTPWECITSSRADAPTA
jgi:AraC-like DNA-binding protein